MPLGVGGTNAPIEFERPGIGLWVLIVWLRKLDWKRVAAGLG